MIVAGSSVDTSGESAVIVARRSSTGVSDEACVMSTPWVRVRATLAERITALVVQLLGPISAETDGVRLRLRNRKQRAVFAPLALQVYSPVALNRLVHELWHDEPPVQ